MKTGEHSPSLPELEILSLYFKSPIEHFWGSESLSEQPETSDLTRCKDEFPARNASIAALLRKARLKANLTLEELAEKSSLPEDQLGSYESGQTAIPLPELITLANLLEITIKSLYDSTGTFYEWHARQKMCSVFLSFPLKYRTLLPARLTAHTSTWPCAWLTWMRINYEQWLKACSKLHIDWLNLSTY